MAMRSNAVPRADGRGESSARAPEPHPSAWAPVAVFAVACAGVPWAAPFAAALPFFWHRYRGQTDGAVRRSVYLRWVLSTLVVAAAAVGLMGARAVHTVPLGSDTVASVRAWLAGDGGAPPGILWMLAVTAVFALAASVARGMLAWLVVATVTLQASTAAATVYSRAENLVVATPAALPLWTVAWLAGMAIVLGRVSGPRPQSTPAPSTAGDTGRRGAVTGLGAGLIVLALVLRLVLASLITTLARRVTIL